MVIGMRSSLVVLVMAGASACVLDDKNVGNESMGSGQEGSAEGGSSSAEGGSSGTSDGSGEGEGSTSNATSLESGPSESSGDDTMGEESGTGGCADPDGCPQPMNGFEDGLDAVGGCSNINVFATDHDLYVLAVSTQGTLDLIGQAEAAGAPIEVELAIGVDDVFAEVIYGEGGDSIPCNDAVDPGLVVSHLIASEGTIALVVDPPDENGNAIVDVTITNARFSHVKGGTELTLDEYVWTDVTVGWLPG